MTSNIKKLLAMLKKNGWKPLDGTNATMAELKEAFGELHKLEEKKEWQELPEPDPTFPWTQTREIQEARLRVPEPSHMKSDRVQYIIPQDGPMDFLEHIHTMDTLKRGSFTRQLFKHRGMSYWAWTADGKTPVFPIPL